MTNTKPSSHVESCLCLCASLKAPGYTIGLHRVKVDIFRPRDCRLQCALFAARQLPQAGKFAVPRRLICLQYGPAYRGYTERCVRCVGYERYGGYTERLVDQLYNICSASMVIVNKGRPSACHMLSISSL